MSFPFTLGTPYPCGAGHVICSEYNHDYPLGGQRRMRFTIEAYGDIFHDPSTPPTTGPEALFTDWGPPAEAFIDKRIRPAEFTYANGQFTPIPPPAPPFIAPPAARTPACLVDALCRRGRFIQTPTPRETGA